MNNNTKNTRTGLLVKEDGTMELVNLNSVNGSTLEAMKTALDVRTVDVVRLNDDLDCWVDDEGLLVTEPKPNLVLSLMLSLLGSHNQFICGAGLFLAVNQNTGETLSLLPDSQKAVEEAHRMAVQATNHGQVRFLVGE